MEADPIPASVQDKLRLAYLNEYGPVKHREVWAEVVRLRREREALQKSLPTVMVMQELPEPRETHLLERGAYDAPGEKVERVVPAAVGSLPADARRDRLGLARWLVSRENPMTSRVTVNRLWAQLFGRGLVKTVEDFGSQGDWPSHPELLDWLAVEFMRRSSPTASPSPRSKSCATPRNCLTSWPAAWACFPATRHACGATCATRLPIAGCCCCSTISSSCSTAPG